jgi:hypothetical protein
MIFVEHEEELTVQAIVAAWTALPRNDPKRQIPATFHRLAKLLKKKAGGKDALESPRRGYYRWAIRAPRP